MLFYYALLLYLESLLVWEVTVALSLAPSRLGALERFSFVHQQHSTDVTYCIRHLGIYWFLFMGTFLVHSASLLSDGCVLIRQRLHGFGAVYKHQVREVAAAERQGCQSRFGDCWCCGVEQGATRRATVLPYRTSHAYDPTLLQVAPQSSSGVNLAMQLMTTHVACQ